MSRAAYNLDVYENLVFAVPSARRLRTLLVAAGLVFGLLSYAMVRYAFSTSGAVVATVLVAAFVVPPLASAYATRRFPDFPVRWGYLLGLVATTIGFAFLTVDLLVGPTDGWRVLALGAAVAALTVSAVLVLTAGADRWLPLLVAASPVPLVLIGLPIAGARWYDVPALDTTGALLSLAVVTVGLVGSVHVHEWIFDANVPYIDGSRLTSTLLTRREEDIDAGYPHRPRVQALTVETDGGGPDGRFTLAAPWVHPGPLVNFGGGAVANDVIDGLNDEGSGFFLKVPCTHEEDPAEGTVTERVLEALPEPELADRATKLVYREYGGVRFYGRRYGDSRVVLLEPVRYGDFPPSVLADRVDPADTLIVDRHAYEPEYVRGIRYGSVVADRLRAAFDRFLDDLEEAELGPYEAGTAVDVDGKQVCALVEQVDGQRTVLFGSNENEVSRTMRELEATLDAEFDHAVVFSTDTHHDMHDLAVRRQVDPDRMRSVVESAVDSLGPARAGLDVARAAETRLLGKEYYALQYSINYVLRSFTVSLFVLYVLGAVVLFV